MKISICLVGIVLACILYPIAVNAGFPYPRTCAQAGCNRNAVCILENNRARCECLLGYEKYGFSLRPYNCRRHTSCKHDTCGTNAFCSDRGVSCFCKPGYTGNPDTYCDPIVWG